MKQFFKNFDEIENVVYKTNYSDLDKWYQLDKKINHLLNQRHILFNLCKIHDIDCDPENFPDFLLSLRCKIYCHSQCIYNIIKNNLNHSLEKKISTLDENWYQSFDIKCKMPNGALLIIWSLEMGNDEIIDYILSKLLKRVHITEFFSNIMKYIIFREDPLKLINKIGLQFFKPEDNPILLVYLKNLLKHKNFPFFNRLFSELLLHFDNLDNKILMYNKTAIIAAESGDLEVVIDIISLGANNYYSIALTASCEGYFDVVSHVLHQHSHLFTKEQINDVIYYIMDRFENENFDPSIYNECDIRTPLATYLKTKFTEQFWDNYFKCFNLEYEYSEDYDW